METCPRLLRIPDAIRPFIGVQEPGTRVFRAEGTHDEMATWFDALSAQVGPCVSPGGAAVYAGVTRPGVYKRLKSGRMTAFCFHITGKKKTLFGGEKKLKQLAIVYIPVSECQAWRLELEERLARIEARGEASPSDDAASDDAEGEHTSDMHDFLNFDPKDRKRRGVKYVEDV
jgi:hypothetical protein